MHPLAASFTTLIITVLFISWSGICPPSRQPPSQNAALTMSGPKSPEASSNYGYSTANLPPSLLPAARLVGDTPFLALTDYPDIPYTLHIPPDDYNPDPDHTGPYYDPRGSPPPYNRPKVPLVVVIHGSSRSAAADRDRFARLTPSNHATLAPLFPAGIPGGPNDWDAYKTLRSGANGKGSGFHADDVLLKMLAEVKARWPGIDTEKVVLVGFSAGGSFALRFALLHPERVLAVSVGAPTGGSVIGADDINMPWPRGLADIPEVFGREVQWTEVSKVKWQLVIGSEDDAIEGSLQGIHDAAQSELQRAKSSGQQPDWAKVRKSLVKDRRKVLEDVKSGLASHGIKSTVEVVDGVGHSPEGVLPKVGPFVQDSLNAYLESSKVSTAA